ncbi:MAG: biotin/lipoate A/B protein ligase family protein [Candidatus Woesearchaeota archaeon]
MRGRLIHGPEDLRGPMHMAIDDVLARRVGRGSEPVLRWYAWSEPEIAIGYFQSIRDEVDLNACEQDDIRVFRRMSGGGAVYKDPHGEINYTILIPERAELASILESYQVICTPIITALKSLGIDAEFAGINDITVAGKKISGNAQTRIHGAILQHGTILVDFNPQLMARYLRFSKAKLSDKQVEGMAERVTTLTTLIPGISAEQVMDEISTSFSDYLGIAFEESTISEEEYAAAETLAAQQYDTEAWNRWRS